MREPRDNLRAISTFALLTLIGHGSAAAQLKLSPADWPAAERERYEKLQQHGGGARFANSEKAMIASTSGPLAIHAGVEALRQGGSAADAAIVTALAQIALSAGSWNSYAGIFNMVYYHAAEKKVYFLNAGYSTVLGEDDPLTITNRHTASGRSALVPGFMAGVEAAHKRFGRLPFAALFEPVIYIAEHGFTLDGRLGGAIQPRRKLLTRLPGTRAVFTKPDGTLYAAGDTFQQPALARTLKAVASQGAAYMYSGAWARKLVEVVRQEGGKLSLEDLSRYHAQWEIRVITLEEVRQTTRDVLTTNDRVVVRQNGLADFLTLEAGDEKAVEAGLVDALRVGIVGREAKFHRVSQHHTRGVQIGLGNFI